MRLVIAVVLVLAVVLSMVTGAVAGGGWYLMTPPPDSIRDKQTSPLSQWEQFAAFDTVAECEAGHTQLFNRRMTDLEKTPTGLGPSRPTWSSRYEAAMKTAWAAAAGLCVSSDDPRLVPR